MVNMLATRLPELRAAVPFYGSRRRRSTRWRRSRRAVLPMFADEDERINATWPAYDAALKAAGVRYAAFRYPGTQHGFNNDTTPRYDANAAKLAWQRTLAFFNQELRG